MSGFSWDLFFSYFEKENGGEYSRQHNLLIKRTQYLQVKVFVDCREIGKPVPVSVEIDDDTSELYGDYDFTLPWPSCQENIEKELYQDVLKAVSRGVDLHAVEIYSTEEEKLLKDIDEKDEKEKEIVQAGQVHPE